jgi:hypothetical protein
METIDKSPSAFPCPAERHGDSAGLSIRDYFAAKAMQAILGSIMSDKQTVIAIHVSENLRQEMPIHCSNMAYVVADAMLKAREGK